MASAKEIDSQDLQRSSTPPGQNNEPMGSEVWGEIHPYDASISGQHNSPFIPGSNEPSWKSWTREQVVPCILIYMGFATQTMCMMMVGPSLIDLQLVTNTTVGQSSWFVSTRAVGALIGSIILSKTFELKCRWYLMTASVFVSGVTFIIVPWIQNFPAVLFMFILTGVGMGYFTTGGMLSIYSIWTEKKDSVSWLNGGQLVLVCGGILGPLVVRPFFASERGVPDETTSNSTNENQSVWTNLSTAVPPDPTALPPGSETYIMYAFLIAGVCVIITSICMVVGDFFLSGITFEARNPMQGASKTRFRLLPLKIGIMIVLFMFHVVTGVLVRVFAAYIVTFTVNYLDWSKEKGSLLTSVTFIAAILSKVACIFIVRCVKTELQLFSGLLINITGSVVLLYFIDRGSWVIWVCCCVIALGDANITATILAWTDHHVGIKGIVGALYNIGGTVGEIVVAPLVGWLFEDISYESFLYLIAACAIANFIFMCFLQCMGMRYKVLVETYGTDEEEEKPLIEGKKP